MNRLDSLQQGVLRAFFKYESQFFLTGGAALAGYHLQHRTTKDLDLFTVEDRIEEGSAALAAAARRQWPVPLSLIVGWQGQGGGKPRRHDIHDPPPAISKSGKP